MFLRGSQRFITNSRHWKWNKVCFEKVKRWLQNRTVA